MDKILELEKLLKDAAALAEELNTANNALKYPGDHMPGVRSRILGAADSLAFHKQHVTDHPELAQPAAPAPAA